MVIFDYQKAIAIQAATTCIKEVKRVRTENIPTVNGFGCSDIAYTAFSCLEVVFFKVCPTKLQNPDQDCVKARKFVK